MLKFLRAVKKNELMEKESLQDELRDASEPDTRNAPTEKESATELYISKVPEGAAEPMLCVKQRVEERAEDTAAGDAEQDVILIPALLQKNEAEGSGADVMQKDRMEDYLAGYGFSLDFEKSKSYDKTVDGVKALAGYINDRHARTNDFLCYLRQRITKDSVICYNMEKLSPAERAETTRLAHVFASHGLISGLYFNSHNNTITGQVATAPKAVAFLTGGWLEIYVRSLVEEIVKEQAAVLGKDYELYSNLFIRGQDGLHELDVAFRLSGGALCIIECKSGKVEWNKLTKLKTDLGELPFEVLLINAGIEPSAAESAAFFHDIYCCGTDRSALTALLSQMIEKSVFPVKAVA